MRIEANEKNALLRLAYSREGCYWALCEDYFTRNLYLIGALGGERGHTTDLRFDLIYLEQGQPSRYDYFGDEGALTLRTRAGWSEVLLDYGDEFRFRSTQGGGLRLVLRSMVEGRGAAGLRSVARLPDGVVEAAMGKYGVLHFHALRGIVEYRAVFDREKGAYVSFELDFLPDAEGVCECALRAQETTTGDCPGATPFFQDFDTLREENRRSLAEFAMHYRAAPARWRALEEELIYTVWSEMMRPQGFVQTPLVMMHRNCLSTALAWQQSYNAMAMLCAPAEGFRLIESMFRYQNPVSGALPVDVSPGALNDTNTQPPLQGFALTFLVRQCGENFITREMAQGLLPRFERWVGFWTTWRSAGRGDDLVAIHNPNESGWDDASIFVRGFPAINADTQAMLIECMYACAILARRAGLPEREAAWTQRAERLLHTLVTEFWDGEKFITKYKGEPVESMSLACYQPILLGDRLPKEITRVIAQKLTEEGHFLSPIGLCTESMRSPMCHWGWHFTLGRVIGPANMFCAVGLALAGEKEAARTIAERWCENVALRGPRLGFRPDTHYPLTGKPADTVPQPHIGDSWSWTSWSACATLTMLQTVFDD